MSWILAIDVGTTSTAAARRVGERVEVIQLQGGPRMPSTVFWREGTGGTGSTGRLVLGTEAEELSTVAPWCLEPNPKSRLGEELIQLGDKQMRPVEMIAAILREVLYEAIALSGGESPGEIRLTHPARWQRTRIEKLRQAAELAGIADPVFVPEPVAAAVHFASSRLREGEHVAVYDLGGGTLDTAVLRRTASSFEVVGRTGGNEELGGEDFDDLLYRHLGEQLGGEAWGSLRSADERRDRTWAQVNRELRRQARRAKEYLSRNPEYELYLPSPVDQELIATVDDLERLIAPALRGTVSELERTILATGLRTADVKAIYLAGGSSRIPLVARLIHQELGVEPGHLDDPKAVIAMGAARIEGKTATAPAATVPVAAAPAPPPPPPAAATAPAPAAPPPPAAVAGAPRGGVSVPRAGLLLASAAALATGAVMFAVGLALALALPETSIISSTFADGSTIKGAFRGAASTTLAPLANDFGDYTIRLMPAIFGLLLVLVAALSVVVVRRIVPGARELAPRSQVLWGAATGVPLAVILLVFGLISKESVDDLTVTVAVAPLILLSLLWGAIGGGGGALLALRREGRLGELGISSRLAGALRLLGAALLPLAGLLAVSAVIGTAVWVVQVARNAGDIKGYAANYAGADGEASTGALIADSVLLAGDHGVHFAELGSGSQFHAPLYDTLGLPAPVTKADELYDPSEVQDFLFGVDESPDSITPPGTFRIFAYSGALSTVVFIAALGLIALAAAAALLAGYRLARARGAAEPGAGAAYGALVGPIWAVTMVLLNLLVQKDVAGKAVTLNVGLNFLVGGLVLGALGGLAAARRAGGPAPAPSVANAPPPPPPPA